jgi:hypothetical protein
MSQMFLNVVSTFKGDGLAAATRQLGAFGSAAGGLGSTLGKVGSALAAFGVVTKTIQFGKESIDSARDLERNLFSVETVFDSFSPKILQFTKDAEQLGLSQKDAAKASTFLGSVLKQSGFSMEFVTAETQKLVSLGVDLATTYGYDVQEALLGMTALFRGEYDPIEKFGVAMKQSEINSELAARGLDDLEGAARRNAEQTIRLELLYQRAADATGAFKAQSGNLFVEQQKLQAQWENMQAQIGTQLLPVMGELVSALKPLVDEVTPRFAKAISDATPLLKDFIKNIEEASDSSTVAGTIFNGLANILGGLFGAIARNFNAFASLAIALGTLRVAVLLVNAAFAATPIGFLLTGLGLLAPAFILVADAAKQAKIDQRELNKQWKESPWQQAVNPARVYSGILSDVIRKDLDPHAAQIEEIKKAWTRAERAAFDYSTVARTAATTRPLRGRQAEALFAAQDFALGIDPNGEDNKGKADAPVLSAVEQLNKDLKIGTRLAGAQTTLLGAKLKEGLVDQILGMAKPLKSANSIINSITKKDGTVKKKEVNRLNAEFSAGLSEQNRIRAEASQAAIAQAQEAERLAEQLRQAEKDRIDGLNQLYANFLDTIKGTFANIRNAIQGAFDITGLGGSTNAILRNMDKLLTKLKSFSTNVKQLATMGLDPALLQQIITAGPMAGARIASALVAGGAGALSAINAGYGQVGNLASEIATTGVQSLFDTQKQQNVYNITVTGGVGSGSTIGKAIVDAIKDYERTSGAVWQGA